MWTRTILNAVAPLFLFQGPQDSSTTAVSRNDCRLVRGVMVARVASIRPTLAGLRMKGSGSSEGDLVGPIEVQALKRIGGRLEVSFRIGTERGALTVKGLANAPSHPTLANTREVSSELTVRGESGDLLAASGTLEARGVANTRTRDLRVEYTGRVCQGITPTAQPADSGRSMPAGLDSRVDTNPIRIREQSEKRLDTGV